MRVISVINQKGGVGKTTTSVNLAHALVMQNYRVTLIDLDPQGHLGASLGVLDGERAIDIDTGIDSALLHNNEIKNVICHIREGLQLIPAGRHLHEVEHMQEGGAARGMLLKNALQGELGDQDFILIDCPPSSGLLAINALFAGDEVLVPVVGDYLALCGVSQLMQMLKSFEQIAGRVVTTRFALTRFYPRGRLAREVMKKLTGYFPGMVLSTAIRETIALAESPAHGKTIFEYSPQSHGAQDYRMLADDLIHGRAL